MPETCSGDIPVWHKLECKFLYLLDTIGAGHFCFRLLLSRVLARTSTDKTQDELTVDSLVTNYDQYSCNRDLFEYAMTAWLISLLLKSAVDSIKLDISVRQIDSEKIGHWCFETLLRVQCNAQALVAIQFEQSNSKLMEEFTQIRYGCSLFPAMSMLNHACKPNICVDFEGCGIVVRCLTTIKEGDELLNCYGPQYPFNMSTRERKRMLRSQYFFECNCKHCEAAVEPEETDHDFNFLEQILQCKHENISQEEIKRKLQILNEQCDTFHNFKSVLNKVDDVARTLSETGYSPQMKIAEILIESNINLIALFYGNDSLHYAWECLKLNSLNDNRTYLDVAKKIFEIHFGPSKAHHMVRRICI
ncbi:SET and MYND domain-containing protein 4 [Cichlidogyrus casuarinus]|uniref:SET and MYND domain-containing protein 4 n=1 Tax=Cichlidogyrus casuarinus TaxID=1844966 RepID=A0ABD2Q994_9PLAT